DRWSPLSTEGAPEPRYFHQALWTGSRMIVYGGTQGGRGLLASGGLYDPATGKWSPMATTGAPEPRVLPPAVWTGHAMLLWGGCAYPQPSGAAPECFNTGSRYDPALDTGSPISSLGAPGARGQHAAVWTGTEMIVWGGPYPDGGRYTPGPWNDDDHDGV